MTKRVTFLQPHMTLAVGSTILLLEVSKRMALRGWQVSVVSSRSDPVIVADAQAAGVRFVDVGGPLSSSIGFWLLFPLIFYRIQRATRAIGADVIVSGAFPAIWWGWLYKAFNPEAYHIFYCFEPSAFIYNTDWTKSIKPFYMRWGLVVFNPLLRFIERTLYPFTDYTVAISDYTRRETLRVYPKINPTRLKLIYPGINHDVYFNPRVERLPRIVIMGTLTKFKNADWVIRAVAVLKKEPQFRNVTLVIKGKGEEKANLVQLTQDLRISDSVAILDTYFSNEQLRKLLGGSRVIVHAAHNEAFGLAPVEAMACGTPAVVTGSGGTGETVVNGISGLYFEPGNINDLAQKLKTLLADDVYWTHLSAGAIARAEEFSWEKNTDEFCALLERTSVGVA